LMTAEKKEVRIPRRKKRTSRNEEGYRAGGGGP